MSPQLFRIRIARSQLSKNDIRWMPQWIDRFAEFLPPQGDLLAIDQNSVLAFLRQLRDSHFPAWQRLQAVRALEWYGILIFDHCDVDFAFFKEKLRQRVNDESRIPPDGNSSIEDSDVSSHIPGEGHPGHLPDNEPTAIQRLRARMRLLHHPRSTEDAYAGWLSRFMKHIGTEAIDAATPQQIGEFLSDLAVAKSVTASTQNQALCSLLYYYQKVLQRELNFIQRVRAKQSHYLPVVLSQSEVRSILPLFPGSYEVMARLMYGSGLRHRECRTLRIKDIHFESGHIVVIACRLQTRPFSTTKDTKFTKEIGTWSSMNYRIK